MTHFKLIGAIFLCALLLVPATILASFVQKISGFAYGAETWLPWPFSEVISYWFPAACMGFVSGFLALLLCNLLVRGVDYQVVSYVISTIVIILTALIWVGALMNDPVRLPVGASFQSVGVVLGLFLALSQTKETVG